MHYDITTIRLHWATALLIGVLWIIGQTADWIPDGRVNNACWSVHLVLGFMLAAVLIWRIVWRGTGGSHLPPADTGGLQVISRAVHYILYTLLVLVIALGVANAFVRGYHLFGLLNLPQIGDRALKKPITEWHGLAANILLAVAFLHALAALAHHYIMRDRVLQRMLP
jgi:cytochrome b561